MRNNIRADGAHLDCSDKQGTVLGINGTGQIFETAIQGLGCPNGLAFSPDGARLYWADSSRNRIWTGRFDTVAGTISAVEAFGESFERGVPDGSAVDELGFVWNARFGSSCVVRFAPDGRVDRVIDLPVTNPTCCTFGGATHSTLFVTSASLLASADEPLAGSVSAIDVGVAGAAAAGFELITSSGVFRP